MDLERLVARPIAGLIGVDDARAPLRVLIASLAPGGAERIVLEWLAAERSRGRPAELAVLHARRNALAVPQGVSVRMRAGESVDAFLGALAHEWRTHPAPVSTHLIADDQLAILWSAGVRTVPTVHNAPEGWRNAPERWREEHVPLAIACAESVRRDLIEHGCRVPACTVRHRPRVGAAAFDLRMREQIRGDLRIAPATLLVAAVGAIKPQKHYVRVIEVLAALTRRRDAALLILGGALDAAGLAEIDRLMRRATDLGVAARLRLPGFVDPIEPWLAACDALLNVSRFEGLSMAVHEALAAGLPVVATNVGGHDEIVHANLTLVNRHAGSEAIAATLACAPVRAQLAARPFSRAPRVASVATAARRPSAPRMDTLFVTANLNAGGAQRSLVNLARHIARRHRLAVAVCGETTYAAFAGDLRTGGIEVFKPAATSDAIAVAESVLAHAGARGCANVCFWNVDARVKLLVAKFAPGDLRVVDASPGDYAFSEMEAAGGFAESVSTSAQQYYARLDTLVLKYHARSHPACRRAVVIPNGVEFLPISTPPMQPRFLVSGRIAPSKRLEDILAAFARLRGAFPAAQLHVFGCVEERHRAYGASLLESPAAAGVHFRGACLDLSHLREPWTAAVVLGTHQGSPNAVLEAMAAGVAVIANDSGGTRELVETGQTGWLLPEDVRIARLAEAMHEAAGGPAAAMGARARERVRTYCTLEAMALRYLEILAPETVPAHEKMAAWNPYLAHT